MKQVQEKIKPNIRELTLQKGLGYPSDEELIMLILGRGQKGISIQDLSSKIMKIINSSELPDLVESLEKIKGVGKSRALAVAAAIELGRRKTCHLKALVMQPTDILPYIKHYSIEEKEHFICITLSGAHEIIQIHVTSIGTINKTLVHPREIFSMAIKENAAAIIVCHNHPSGNVTPSEDDIQSTQILYESAQLLGISLLDHIIIGADSYFSFVEHNLLIADS